MMLLAATMLMFGLSGQAMAYFADGDLIRIVYSATGGNETATDLGSIAGLTTSLTSSVTYNTNNFSISALGSGATTANSYVAYYAYVNDSNYNDNVWTSGNQGGQSIAGSVAVSNFPNAAEAMGGLYSTTPGGAQVTIATSNGGSYYTNMNLSGLGNGQMAGYTPNGDAEKNLAALATTGYVDQTLYYYMDDVA